MRIYSYAGLQTPVVPNILSPFDLAIRLGVTSIPGAIAGGWPPGAQANIGRLPSELASTHPAVELTPVGDTILTADTTYALVTPTANQCCSKGETCYMNAVPLPTRPCTTRTTKRPFFSR